MPLDPSLIGTTRAGGALLITRSRLRLFAKATGQTGPQFVDVDAAHAAGHRDLPVPPTFFFSAELERPDPFDYLDGFGIDLRTVLHGEQRFEYYRTAFAGDELSTSSVVTDVYEKKGGALQFMVTTTSVSDQDGNTVAVMQNTLVAREMSGVSA